MAKLQTVNVIEIIEHGIANITSFTDDKEGNEEAEQLFIKIIKENVLPDELPESEEFYLEEGYFEQGDYEVLITHS